MAFYSILYERPENRPPQETEHAPACFADLNLDQVVTAVTLGKQEYRLSPFFYMPLRDNDAIAYRHEIFHELKRGELLEHITAFAKKMRVMREHVVFADKLHYAYQKERWFLEAVEAYCDAVLDLARDLSAEDLQSRGFLAFRDYVASYAASEPFTSLVAETKHLIADLAAVRYCVQIKYNRVRVRQYADETDYSAEVQETFGKFAQGAVKDYRVKFRADLEMNHVEGQILEFVARLYPDIFSRLDDYCANHANYLDETIGVFDREIQFYLAYVEFIAFFEGAGLKFCYPRMSDHEKEVRVSDSFDVALANALLLENAPVVCNDFFLTGQERIMIVSGPNQGGKTTFARAFGQLHYLASLGCPVPGRDARLFLFDKLFTHFEQEENIANLRGKLHDDLVRMREILDQATPNSLIIMNEIFTSTALKDAVFLSRKVMERIMRLDALCVCVTFLDELASLSETTVSMVSTVVTDNPASRTYKIIRKHADGLAYAISIAEKYRLTYDVLKERIAS